MQVDVSSTGRLYGVWCNMKQRCLNPKNKYYSTYGERGITVCGEWMWFIPFRDWALSHGYNDQLEIERKDSDKGYNPDNCIWVDEFHQQANKRKRSGTLHKLIGVRKIHGNKWRAVIDVKKVQTHIGVFPTESEAAIARDEYIIANGLPHKLNF